MASEESAALKILQGQVESLTTQLQTLTSERDEYRDALAEVSEERDSLKTEPAAAARIAELEAAARDRTHYDRFAELAKGAKAKDKALKQLWRDAKDRGYELAGDEVDEKALQTVLAKLKTEVDYAFDPEETSTTTAAKESAKTDYGLTMRQESAAGGGRSGRNQGGDGTIVTAEMRADPKFMLDPRNKELIVAAAKEGRFR